MKNITRKGFTLLEILLVITLLSIIMIILIRGINPNEILSGIQDNQREADALKIYQAIEEYALKNNTYPDDIKDIPNNSSLYICKTSASNCANFNQINLSTDILVPTYLSKIPEYSTDANNSGFYVVKDTNGKIGVGGVRQLDETTFVKGLESQSFENIITDGLVLYLDTGYKNSYPGTGNTWFDLSGFGNNGTLVNGVGYNSDNGGSLVFDGVNDYVAIDNLGFSSNTIEGWIYSNDGLQGGSGGDNIISVIGTYTLTGGSLGKYTYIGVLGSNTLTWRIDDGVTSHALVVDVNYTANQWYHVALSYNSNGSTIAYLNGVSVGSINFTSDIIFNSVPFNVCRAENGQVFDGLVSSVKAYNRALTPQEIQQNFNAIRELFGL